MMQCIGRLLDRVKGQGEMYMYHGRVLAYVRRCTCITPEKQIRRLGLERRPGAAGRKLAASKLQSDTNDREGPQEAAQTFSWSERLVHDLGPLPSPALNCSHPWRLGTSCETEQQQVDLSGGTSHYCRSLSPIEAEYNAPRLTTSRQRGLRYLQGPTSTMR